MILAGGLGSGMVGSYELGMQRFGLEHTDGVEGVSTLIAVTGTGVVDQTVVVTAEEPTTGAGAGADEIDNTGSGEDGVTGVGEGETP